MLQEETIQSHHYGERIFFYATEYFSKKMWKSTTADDKLPLTFTNVHSFKVLSETPGTMYVKFSLHGEAAPVTFAKRGWPVDVSSFISTRNQFQLTQGSSRMSSSSHECTIHFNKSKEMGSVMIMTALIMLTETICPYH